ncbi:DUF1801 domain-containing protein [Paenibacillus pasadenensis]|uniref:DUF1801 domain-containing protein n=1 Tax=Paenibacillus pasadenensis TaxID=217090 RepID=UPI00203B10F8|nr:DUF1801 domain-containing protein [Paenibacillus pasadenensis]MCM3749520.1 DUF1801 domain-containing protein [Paenibacillus pasadenensis]
MNPEVTAYIEQLDEGWKVETASSLRELVYRVIPDTQERMQYKKPHFLKNGSYAAVISVAKSAVSFTIFNASGVEWPQSFDGPPERKTIKLTAAQKVDDSLLEPLLQRASSGL